MTTSTYETDREVYANMIPDRLCGGYTMAIWRQIERDGLQEAVRKGLDAIAALWFDSYEDEKHLPEAFADFVRFVQDEFGIEVISDRLNNTPSLEGIL